MSRINSSPSPLVPPSHHADVDSTHAAAKADAVVAPTRADAVGNRVDSFLADSRGGLSGLAKEAAELAKAYREAPSFPAAILRFLGHKATESLAKSPQSTKSESAAPAAKKDARPALEQGMKNAEVTKLQNALRATGARIGADGDFGERTRAAVEAFQKAHPPLEVTGKVDAATWEALDKAAAAKATTTQPAQPKSTAHTADGTPMWVQGDARWGQVTLGNSDKTLSQAGCLLSSVAMVLSRELGRDVSPQELNEVLTRGGAFQAKDASKNQNGSLLIYADAARVIEAEYGIKLPLGERAKDRSGKDIAGFVDGELAAGRQVVLHVDTDSKDGPNHFVVVNRKEGNEYVVVDPSLGKEYRYTLGEDGSFKATSAYYPHREDGKFVYDTPVAHGYIHNPAPPSPKAK